MRREAREWRRPAREVRAAGQQASGHWAGHGLVRAAAVPQPAAGRCPGWRPRCTRCNARGRQGAWQPTKMFRQGHGCRCDGSLPSAQGPAARPATAAPAARSASRSGKCRREQVARAPSANGIAWRVRPAGHKGLAGRSSKIRAVSRAPRWPAQSSADSRSALRLHRRSGVKNCARRGAAHPHRHTPVSGPAGHHRPCHRAAQARLPGQRRLRRPGGRTDQVPPDTSCARTGRIRSSS